MFTAAILHCCDNEICKIQDLFGKNNGTKWIFLVKYLKNDISELRSINPGKHLF